MFTEFGLIFIKFLNHIMWIKFNLGYMSNYVYKTEFICKVPLRFVGLSLCFSVGGTLICGYVSVSARI